MKRIRLKAHSHDFYPPNCPYCHAPVELSVARHFDHEPSPPGYPKTGDVNVCYECGEASEYHNIGGHLVLEKLTTDEVTELRSKHPELRGKLDRLARILKEAQEEM